MKEQLQLLERLQEIDDRIDSYTRDLTRLPLEIQDIARNLVVMRREMSEARDKTAVLEKDLRKKEQDLAVEQEKIKRSERRLLGIKNQKEYNALSREIKLGKKVASEIEDASLGLMTEIEGLKKTLDRKEKEYELSEKTLLEKKAENETVTAEANKALASLNAERENITPKIESDFLKRYQKVKEVRGQAIAELQNNSCGRCHIAIPPQLSIRVLKQEEMITCPNCHRILYVKPENIPEFNKMDV